MTEGVVGLVGDLYKGSVCVCVCVCVCNGKF